jgi:predicted N-formylglutamate amidohydrolase
MFWQSLILHASVNKLVLGVFSPLVIDENRPFCGKQIQIV